MYLFHASATVFSPISHWQVFSKQPYHTNKGKKLSKPSFSYFNVRITVIMITISLKLFFITRIEYVVIMFFRDLSNNGLEEWKVDAKYELLQLRYVVLVDNPFIPGQQFLTLPMLIVLQGVSWSQSCQNCLLLKTNFLKNLTAATQMEFCEVRPKDFRWHDEVPYGLSFWFAQNGFSAQCLCASQQCISSDKDMPYNLELNLIIRQLFYIEYVLGVIAIFTNLVVILTIVLSRTLHKPSFILICNIALCDLLMGVYSILIGRFTVYEFIVHEHRYPNMDVFVNDYCSAMGFIFSTSQLVAVPTSLLMTIERFLSIVYCMNPGRRLRMKKCLIICVVFWCGGMSYAALPLARVGGLRFHGEYQCMLPFVNGEHQSDVSKSTLAIAILLAMVYMITITLYIPIYRYVKNTSQTVGVKRKATLAKNIAIMIFTNFMFFLAPLISTIIFVYCYEPFMKLLQVDTMRKLQTYFIFLSWLPVVLLSINSCLNPFLCAFRHPQFQAQILLAVKIIRKQTFGGNNTVPGTQSNKTFRLTHRNPEFSTRNAEEIGVSNCTFEQSHRQSAPDTETSITNSK